MGLEDVRLIDDTFATSCTPCTQSADDHARISIPHRTPCILSARDCARRLFPHRTPCIQSVHDRARRFQTHRTPCTYCADDRAHRLIPHRTPCTESAHDRARRLIHHRTPCNKSDDDHADTHCTPCTSTEVSPRARTARSASGLSSASCPSWSTRLSDSRQHRHRRYPELQSSRVAATPSSSLPRAP